MITCTGSMYIPTYVNSTYVDISTSKSNRNVVVSKLR